MILMKIVTRTSRKATKMGQRTKVWTSWSSDRITTLARKPDKVRKMRKKRQERGNIASQALRVQMNHWKVKAIVSATAGIKMNATVKIAHLM